MSNHHMTPELEDDSVNETIQYVTIFISGQLFGLPINRVHDVFVPESVTPRSSVSGGNCRCAEPPWTDRDGN